MDRLDFKLDRRADNLDEKIGWVAEELKETREDLSAKIEAVGDKVGGHEERIEVLERKVA